MGEKLDHQVLMDKVVRYTAAVPARVVYLTAGIDSQRNRFEMYVWGWAPGEEAFLVDKIIIMGRPDEEETLLRVDAAINKKIPPCGWHRNDYFPCLLGHRGDRW